MKTTTTEPTRLRDLKTGVRDLISIDPQNIVIEKGHNPRDYTLKENRDHLDELKASIRENGTQQPLWVRWEPETKQAILVDGECRLRANLELIKEGVEIKSVPVIQVQGGNEPDRLLLALTANTGKPLSKWEIGSAFRKLVNFGWSNEDISKKTGYTIRYIKESLELSDAPDEVKYLLSEQAVTPSLAISHIRKSGSGAVLSLRSAVANAKAGKNGKKIAKRERKAKGVSLSPDDCKKVIEALKEGAIQKDKKCGELCEAALEVLRGKGIE